MRHTMRMLVVMAACFAATLAMASGAAGVTPEQLREAGWACRIPQGDPTRLICAAPGRALPPFPGTPDFADRAPSYEALIFALATGEFIGTQHLLRPDVYLRGTPPCPQLPSGEYFYVPGIDLWACVRLK